MFNRIADYLAGIGVDKYIHFNACMFIAFGLSVLLALCVNVYVAAIVGFISSATIGYAKEVTDQKNKGGGIDKGDIKADVLGAIVGVLMSLL